MRFSDRLLGMPRGATIGAGLVGYAAPALGARSGTNARGSSCMPASRCSARPSASPMRASRRQIGSIILGSCRVRRRTARPGSVGNLAGQSGCAHYTLVIDFQLRLAEREDCPSMSAIYNEVVRNSTAIYEDKERDPEEMAAWFDRLLGAGYPVLVICSPTGEPCSPFTIARLSDSPPRIFFISPRIFEGRAGERCCSKRC